MLSLANVTVSRAPTRANAYIPIEVTLFGMVIEAREVSWNAREPIEVRALPAEKVSLVSEVEPRNALPSIEVTLAGITASPAQFVSPVTTLSVIVKVPPALQLTVAAHAGGATRVAPSKASTAISDNFFDFSNIRAPFK